MTATFYTALGIAQTATAAEIKEAYRKLSEIHHPDRGGDPERFKLITAAFTAAKNIAARRRGGFGNKSDQAWQRAWDALTPTAKAPKAARTFCGDDHPHWVCDTCGQEKPTGKYPTITGRGMTGKNFRGVECRTCRDARTKAAKATANAA